MRISDWSSDVCSSDLRPLACRDRHEREGWHHDLLGPAERDAAEKVAAPELAASFLHAEPALEMDVLAAGKQPVRQRRLYGAPVVGQQQIRGGIAQQIPHHSHTAQEIVASDRKSTRLNFSH